MKREDLPERWVAIVRKYLAEKGSKYSWLGAGDFGVSS
jgi:hypothetical protein